MESISNSLKFTDLTQDDILPILNEVYGYEIELTEQNIDHLLILADRFDIKSLVQKFTKHRAAMATPKNVFKIYQFARDFNLFDLVEFCKKYICQAIIEYSYRAEFRALNDADVEALLNFQEITCKSEVDLLAVICRWANNDFSGRIVSAFWLLFSLRYKYPRSDNFKTSYLEQLAAFRHKFTVLIDKFYKIVDDVQLKMELRSDNSNCYSESKSIDDGIVSVLKDHMMCTTRSRATQCHAPNILVSVVFIAIVDSNRIVSALVFYNLW